MRKLAKTSLTITIGLSLVGCATMQTARPVAGSTQLQGGEGIEYYLAEGYFDLTIIENDGTIKVRLSGPRMIPDYDFPLRTRLLASGMANNDFSVVVGHDGLLQSVTGNSEGQLGQILASIANLVIPNSDKVTLDTEVFNHPFRFSDLSNAQLQANATITLYVESKCQSAAANDEACNKLRRILPFASSNRFVVITSPHGNRVAAPGEEGSAQQSNQRIDDALFYRPLAPFQVTISLATGQTDSEVFAVPDRTRVSYVRAPGGVFARQEYAFAFEDGALFSYRRIARNEVAGVVGVPLDIVTSILAAPAQALAGGHGGANQTPQNPVAVPESEAAKNATAAQRSACTDRHPSCGLATYRHLEISSGSTGAATAPPGGDSSATPGSGMQPDHHP